MSHDLLLRDAIGKNTPKRTALTALTAARSESARLLSQIQLCIFFSARLALAAKDASVFMRYL